MKWVLIGFMACAAIVGCESSETSVEKSKHASSVMEPALLEAVGPSIDPRDHPLWEAIALDAAREYSTQYGQVSRIGWIPTDCRAPLAGESPLKRDKSHNGLLPENHEGLGKIGLLFAKNAENYLQDPKGAGASVGQTIVKRAYEAVPINPEAAEHEDVDMLVGPRAAADAIGEHIRESMYTPGDLTGVCVMHRLDPETPGTDHGWIYATLSRPGLVERVTDEPWKVTAVGRIDSCVACHRGTGPNRLFGAGDRAMQEPIFWSEDGSQR